MKNENTIVVFTARSPGRIIEEGGSQAWVLNPARGKNCEFLVCTQNRHNPDHEFSDATEEHGAAFLVGKISGIVASPEGRDDRWLIEISEFARINKPDVWNWRNPVRYTSLSELGIDLAGVKFEPTPNAKERPAKREAARPREAVATAWPPATLTIPEAKKALAATFGVKPDAVEITIRG
jgi:hypothetical protein